MKASPPTWKHPTRIDIVYRGYAILKALVMVEYSWIPGSLPNQSILPTWGQRGLAMPARCTQWSPAHKHHTVVWREPVHTVESSSQAPHCRVEGTQLQLVPGFQLPRPCVCAAEAFPVSFLSSNRWTDEASFSDLFSRQLICRGSGCTFKHLCVKKHIYICVDKTKKIF